LKGFKAGRSKAGCQKAIVVAISLSLLCEGAGGRPGGQNVTLIKITYAVFFSAGLYLQYYSFRVRVKVTLLRLV